MDIRTQTSQEEMDIDGIVNLFLSWLKDEEENERETK